MCIGSNVIYICPFSIQIQVKITRKGNLKFLIKRKGGKTSKSNKRRGPNKSVEGGKIS